MENIFIKETENTTTKEITHRAQFDWNGFWKPMMAFLKSEIDYENEYREWVIQWREYEKELVAAIRFFRQMRIDYGDPYLKNSAQREKINLRYWARLFYEKRVERKEIFKNSEFFKNRELNKVSLKELETC